MSNTSHIKSDTTVAKDTASKASSPGLHDYEAARSAIAALHDHGFEAYIIGGAVRDLYLDRHPKDFDLATNATPEQIMALPEFKRSKYKDTSQAYGVTRTLVLYNGHTSEIEIATFRKDIEAIRGRQSTKIAFASLEDDVLRRDFTINALAFDPSTNVILDFTDGIDDLHNRVVRFIGNPSERIREDPLRIMRAIRFKNHLGFSYYPGTVTAIKEAVRHGYIEQIAVNRLRAELTSLLLHPSRREALADLDCFGILELVLPEVSAGKNITQPPEFHAEGDVWQHELLILDYLPTHPSIRLAWAALLHDIGKVPTHTVPHTPDDRIRFNRHYAVGAEMAKTILRRLKFSNRDIKDITWMVYNHLAIDSLPAMRPSHQQQMLGHEAFEDLLELHRADAAASWQTDRPHGSKPQFQAIEELWRTYQTTSPEERQPSLKRDLGIDGKWLLDTFSKEFPEIPGPVIGEVLDDLDNWYRNKRIRDPEKYVDKARLLLQKYQAKRS